MRPSLLVVHLEGVGDTVLSMPLLSTLSQVKDYERHLLLPPGRGDLFFAWDGFDVVEIGDQGKTESLLSKYHDLILDLGTGTDHFIDWIPARKLQYGAYIGFTKPKSVPREEAVPRPVDIPLWQQFMCLASKLGIDGDAIPEFGIRTSALSESYAELLVNFRTTLPLICLAPGAHYSSTLKRWPPEHFARFMQDLHAKMSCRFVLVGDRSEMEIGNTIVDMVEFEIDNVIGLTTLGSLAHIFRQSRLLVANDNGAMHLGGVLGIPTIGLFGPSNPNVYSPLGMASRVIVADSGGIADVDPNFVLKVSEDLLESNTQYGSSCRVSSQLNRPRPLAAHSSSQIGPTTGPIENGRRLQDKSG